MAYDFSFDTGQWWATVAACVIVVLLAFATGFVAGMMWGRRSAPSGRPASARQITHVSTLVRQR